MSRPERGAVAPVLGELRLRIARESLMRIVRLSTFSPDPRLHIIAAEAVSTLRQIGVDVPTLDEVCAAFPELKP